MARCTMRLAALAPLGLIAAIQVANAETLVVIATEPELVDAIRAELAPARVQIIVVDVHDGTAAELALRQRDGYVLWRDKDELVFWDARAATGTRHPASEAMTTENAREVAKSVRAWMGVDTQPESSIVAGPATQASQRRITFEGAMGARANQADDGRSHVRVAVGLSTHAGPVEAAASLEFGQSFDLANDRATGDHSFIGASLHVRHGVSPIPSLRFGAAAGVTVMRSEVDGSDDMARSFVVSAVAPAIDAAVVASWRRSRYSVSADLGGAYVVTTQTMTVRNIDIVIPPHVEPRAFLRLGVTAP